MAPLRPEFEADAAALLWRLLAIVVVVGVALLAVLLVIGSHIHPPTSSDPVLRDGAGYARYVGATSTSLIVSLSCVTSTSPRVSLHPGVYQVPVAGLTIDVAIATTVRRAPIVQSESAVNFERTTLSGQFHGYVVETSTTKRLTDAPGSTGCAGTISNSGSVL